MEPGDPATRTLLNGRERVATSGRFIWDSNLINGQPAYATTNAPAATLLYGPWPTVAIALWGPGVELAINPFDPTAFKQGVISMRALVAMDVIVRQPTAFVTSSSIT
jgi:hypothetical protein